MFEIGLPCGFGSPKLGIGVSHFIPLGKLAHLNEINGAVGNDLLREVGSLKPMQIRNTAVQLLPNQVRQLAMVPTCTSSFPGPLYRQPISALLPLL